MFRIEWTKQFMRLSSQEKKGCFVESDLPVQPMFCLFVN